MRRKAGLWAVAAVLVLGGCGEPEVISDETLVPVPVPTPATATTPPELIGTADTPAGKGLVDGRGHTLYVHAKDTAATDKRKAVSACAAECATTWPPLVSVSGMPIGLPGVDPTALGILVRADGAKQITYRGRPLYLHAADTAPGQAGGAGKDPAWSLAPAS